VPDALGRSVSFEEGAEPKFEPLRSKAAVTALRLDNLSQHLAPVYEAIRLVRRSLPDSTALIGFAGAAPWHTLYIIIEVLKLRVLLVIGWLALWWPRSA
jgi:uroporphyrinogen decarboxylase